MYGYTFAQANIPTLKAASMGSRSTLLTNLHSIYKAESNANDSLGVYNGTAVGGLTYGTGKSGNAFVFNGTNSYVSFPSDFFEPTGSFSFNVWFNTSSIATLTLLCLTNASGYLGLRVYFGGATRNINFSKFPSGTTINTLTSAGGVYTYGVWNMLTIVNDTSVGMLIYCNGTLIASNAVTSAISWGSSTLQRLGMNYNNGTPFDGSLDEVGFWNKALTLSEITELYNSSTGKYYPF